MPALPGQGGGGHDRLPAGPAQVFPMAQVAQIARQRPVGLSELVRQELLGRQLDELLAGLTGLRVLDVGCGTGTQALRLARAGQLVTGLDPDPLALGSAQAALATEPAGVRQRVRLLQGDGYACARWFEPRSFDLVLCHGTLMYLADPDPMLASLARMLGPGGLLSLVVRNAEALAMRPGLAGDWRAALAAFDSPHCTDRLSAPTRADRLSDLATSLAEISVPLREWYGVQLFTGHLPDDPAPVDGRRVAQLLDAEDRAGRQDPYRRLAALLHVVGGKP